ncbi:retrovirus-related pol polyprotein from transposon TNT 1-94 [Tanacetum coccineum]
MSVNHAKYTLVIIDEYSRYTWVYFLKKKNQAAEMIMSFIRMVENQNDIKVKQIRTDNGTEFRNFELESFCDEKGISQNFSSPYTPEQNGVAERKNITLIEAARTMLNGLLLLKNFCTEAVRIACYTQNRSIIVKRHDRTPYEIFKERIPDISYFHVFGCPVFIYNHKDHLGKFDAKADDGYFLGYLFNSKAFRVFNTRRQQIEETYHVIFDESIEAIRFTNTSNAEGTQEQVVQNKQINQPTKESSKNNTETSVHITKSLVPETLQSQHASTSSYPVAQDRWSQNQYFKLVNIIGDPSEGMLTRSIAAKLTAASANECLFVNILSEIEPKKVSKALNYLGGVDSMQEELNQFYRNKVWTLVPLPHDKIAIGSKWVFRNKKDEHGIITKNKARPVAKGYSQEEGINSDETFAPVARMEAIRIFLAFPTYMNFIVFK